MQVKRKTMIVTGASQGIGSGVTKAFIKLGYNVVANSRKITESEFAPADRLVLLTPASSFRNGLPTTPSTILSCSPKRICRATFI